MGISGDSLLKNFGFTGVVKLVEVGTKNRDDLTGDAHKSEDSAAIVDAEEASLVSKELQLQLVSKELQLELHNKEDD